ncbi:MAG: MFS transporter, partial [Elusimicrobia bacterium]|nr:MFS transporter [Elusimicrobiota bacterium]
SAGVAAVKVGIETLNLAVPMLLLSTVHAAAAVSTLYLSAELASLLSGLLGGALVDRLGAGRTMVLTAFVQVAAIAALPVALAAGGALAMPAVYGLFVVNGIAGELFEIGRRSVMPQIVGRDEGLLRKYNGSLYVWREVAATAGVFAAGWFLHAFGAMATIWAHPIFCLAAGFALLKLWKTGGRLEPTEAAQAPNNQAPKLGEKQSLAMKARSWFDGVVNGAKIVVFNKKLRTIVLVNIPLNAVHKIFHTLVAVIYASKMLGNPALAAVLLGAWNLGELAGAWYLERRGPESRISSWLRFAAGASLATWLLWLLPTPFVAVPVSFLMAAAMIGNELGIASFIQASVPQHELGSVNGFVYAFSRAVGMLALFGAGLMFDALSPSGAFLALAVLFTAAAPIYFFASRSFRHDTMPGDIVPMDD